MRSGMFHPLANWLFFQARISGFIFPGLVIDDKWRVDGQRAYKERVLTLVSRQWQFSLSNINICKQFKLTLRSSTIFFSLWTDRLWLGAAVTSVVICEWHLLALHGHYTHKSCMYMYMHVLSLPSLYILTGTNGVRHVAVCLKITRSTSWFHCKRQTPRHMSHCLHHFTDTRSDWQLVKSDGQLLAINLSQSEDSPTIMESYMYNNVLIRFDWHFSWLTDNLFCRHTER